jgi:signal transduction histidine kinase
LALFFITSLSFHFNKDQYRETASIQSSLSSQYKSFSTWKSDVKTSVESADPLFWEFNQKYETEYTEKHFSLFIFEDQKPVYWSNSLTIPDVGHNENGFVQLNNGWFFINQEKVDNYTILYLLQIKEVFPIKNNYLQERFLLDDGIPPGINISIDPVSPHLISIAGYTPFYLDYSKADYGRTYASNINVLAFFLLFISILFLLYVLYLRSNTKRNGKFSAFVFIASVIVLRLIWLNNPFPSIVVENTLFDPSVFAQSFLFPSLGDLILNALVILFIIAIVGNRIYNSSYKKDSANNNGFSILFLGLTIVWVYALNFLFEGLVKNSRIPFNIDYLFELDAFSLIAMFGIALLFLAYFIWIEIGIRFIYKNGISFKLFILFSFTGFALYGAILSGLNVFDFTETFWSLPIILAIATRNWFPQTRLGLGIGIFNLALVSLFLAHVFEKYNIQKEHEIRQVIGERISLMQDPLQEIKMGQQISELKVNPWIKQLFYKDTLLESELAEIELFFTNDWFKYDKNFKKNKADIFVFLDNSLQESNEIRYQETLSDDLYFFHDKSKGVGYLFSIPIVDGSDTLGFLQGTFSELSKPISSGFPQLLRSENNYIQSYASEYNYARYFNGKRIFSSTEVDFPLSIDDLSVETDFEGYVDHNKTSMLVLPEEYGFRWIIAKPLPQLLQKVTSFSYLFLFMGLLTVLILIIQQIFQGKPLFYFSFRSKIQLIFISFILVILTLYAVVIFGQITSQFNQRNKDQITERLHSIHIELGHKLGDVDQLKDVTSNKIASYLYKFSEVFVADISLFDLDGQLNASSSSLIWDKKLLSKQMDPFAYANVNLKESGLFIQEEAVGEFAYLSGYRPLYNDNGKKIAYLNVPYFARQDELRNEISSFIQVLINVFVLLMGLGVIVAIYVSNWITSPLKMLQSSIASLDLVNRNKPIQYSGNDEVASLVNAYNQKVSELEQITESIVQSEKESAWQEMARQVAHEIKNPLTPMRLSIQHYQRLLGAEKEKAIEKTPALMRALIEQIDNLNHIANEFSRFAQISVSKQSEFDLGELMEEVHELYANIEGVTLGAEIEGNCLINADRNQIMRMLNNLIQNAIQATKKEADRAVTMRLKKKNKAFIIEIEDNGTGIPEELEDKIFKPNFTTKSKGMGLGLAIVQTIVSNHAGTIRYSKAKLKGTIFIVDLPFS